MLSEPGAIYSSMRKPPSAKPHSLRQYLAYDLLLVESLRPVFSLLPYEALTTRSNRHHLIPTLYPLRWTTLSVANGGHHSLAKYLQLSSSWQRTSQGPPQLRTRRPKPSPLTSTEPDPKDRNGSPQRHCVHNRNRPGHLYGI